MIKGRKVYDPLTNEWSTGYWIPIYDHLGYVKQYVPVWRIYEKARTINEQSKRR